MKKFSFVILAMICFSTAFAQQKTSWTFTAKKIAGNKYELHMTATPPAGWHVYSQNTPDGGPIPTSFTFNNNALVTLSGKVKETGKTVKYFDKNFKVNVIYFEGKVEFVQVVTVKGKIKTNVSGEVESMICNDRTCMPSTTEKFNIALN
jgi:thiol:disulfide interchange protein DsbD